MTWSLVYQIVGTLSVFWLLNKLGDTISGHARLREEFDQFADDYDFFPDVAIHLTHPAAKLPTYARIGDAGADICNVEDTILLPGEWKVVSCGFQMELPEGWEAQVRSRSGWARKEGVVVLNSPGTIDSGYRGDVGALLFNHGAKKIEIPAGTKIAQMVIARAPQARFTAVEDLSESERGAGGWGSTGR